MTLNDTSSPHFEPEADEPFEAPDIEATPHDEAVARSRRLAAVAKRIHTLRTRLTKTAFQIAEQLDIANIDLPPARRKAFANVECGIANADVKTYLNLSKALGPDRESVEKYGLSLSVLKALTSADKQTQTEALSALESKTPIDLGDIRAIRRRKRTNNETAAQASARHRTMTLRKAVRARAAANFETFLPDFAPFMDMLEAFYYNPPVGAEFEKQATAIKVQAKECLARFERLFDTSSLPQPWEFGIYEDRALPVWMARTHASLQALAKGDLNEIDEDSGNPYDKDNVIDARYFEAINWLFGREDRYIGWLYEQKRSKFTRDVKHISPPEPLISLEICAGAGGEALGLHAAGFRAKRIYERDPFAVQTLRRHLLSLVDRVSEADIREVDFKPMRGMIDLVAGGVPCQGHSSAGKRRGRDDERDLFLEAVRIVDEVRPRAFFFENVEGFKAHGNTEYRVELHKLFNDLGYQNKVFSIRASDYGLAQGRPRVAFIGFRDGEMSRFAMPPVFPEWNPTIASSIGDLVAANGWRGYDAWVEKTNRIGPTIIGGSEKSGKLSFSANFARERWEELGIDMRELVPTAPGPEHGVDELFRLTLEMGARLQGFPDGYEFQGRPMEQKRQIGNALPPIMAKAVGLAIYSALEGVDFDYETALRQPFEVPQPTTRGPFMPPSGVLNLNRAGRALQEVEEEKLFFGEQYDEVSYYDEP